jgi:hypothetical protein
MVIPTVSRKALSMQEMANCDYIRTPVKFSVPDIFVFVGVIQGRNAAGQGGPTEPADYMFLLLFDSMELMAFFNSALNSSGFSSIGK